MNIELNATELKTISLAIESKLGQVENDFKLGLETNNSHTCALAGETYVNLTSLMARLKAYEKIENMQQSFNAKQMYDSQQREAVNKQKDALVKDIATEIETGNMDRKPVTPVRPTVIDSVKAIAPTPTPVTSPMIPTPEVDGSNNSAPINGIHEKISTVSKK